MTNDRPTDTPIDPNVKLQPDPGEPLCDLGRYRKLVEKISWKTELSHFDRVIQNLKYEFPVCEKGKVSIVNDQNQITFCT